jgi:hypothetical protein
MRNKEGRPLASSVKQEIRIRDFDTAEIVELVGLTKYPEPVNN